MTYKTRSRISTISSSPPKYEEAWVDENKSEESIDQNGDGSFVNGLFVKNHGLNWFITGREYFIFLFY